MGPLPVPLLQESPSWWYESWGLTDWLATLFSQPLEVHTFLLGAFIGILLATLTIRQHPRTTLTFILVVVLFTFGSFETVFVCSVEFSACQHIRLKPWYFIGGFLVIHLGAVGLAGWATTDDITSDDGNRTAASPVAGLAILALLGFAVYSFVSTTPVHPITGLATIGGCLGSIFGLAAYKWALAEGPTRYVSNVRQVLGGDLEESVLLIGYGTVLGFGYPRLFWELGSVAGRDEFLFGPIHWARNGLPSIVAYVFVIFLAGLLLRKLGTWNQRAPRSPGHQFAAYVLGTVTYTFCLFVSTGYAGVFWFRLIPSV